MTKALIFDMDGTLADFYNVENWLDYLLNNDPFPYEIAKPIYSMPDLCNILLSLKKAGWLIGITSWAAKKSSYDFKIATTKAKIKWLQKYNFPADFINIVDYGTEKSQYSKDLGGFQILVDDEENNLTNWKLGSTIDAKQNIIPALISLLKNEI